MTWIGAWSISTLLFSVILFIKKKWLSCVPRWKIYSGAKILVGFIRFTDFFLLGLITLGPLVQTGTTFTYSTLKSKVWVAVAIEFLAGWLIKTPYGFQSQKIPVVRRQKPGTGAIIIGR